MREAAGVDATRARLLCQVTMSVGAGKRVLDERLMAMGHLQAGDGMNGASYVRGKVGKVEEVGQVEGEKPGGRVLGNRSRCCCCNRSGRFDC